MLTPKPKTVGNIKENQFIYVFVCIVRELKLKSQKQ